MDQVTPNALAPHSGGAILPYVIVGFGDDSWGIMDGRNGKFALHRDRLRLFRHSSEAVRVALRYVGESAIECREPFSFGSYSHPSGTPRERRIL